MNLSELKIKNSNRKLEAGINARANYLKFAFSTSQGGRMSLKRTVNQSGSNSNSVSTILKSNNTYSAYHKKVEKFINPSPYSNF